MIFLLIICLILTFTFLNRFLRDILSPAIGVCVIFLISTICAMVNIGKWDYHMSFDCYGIIMLAVLLYATIAFIIPVRDRKIQATNLVPSDAIRISSLIFVLSILFMAFAGVLYYRDVIYIVSKYGSFSSWNAAIRLYRNGGMTGEVVEGVSSLATNCYSITTAFAYIYGYVFVHNLVLTKKIKSNIKFLIPILVFSVDTVFTGGRLPILRLLIGMVFVYFFMLFKTKNRKQISSKALVRVSFLAIVGLYLFASLSTWFGRNYDNDPIYYVTSYMGGSIPLLDMFLENPVKHTIWGYETFPSILKYIGRRTNNTMLASIQVNKEFRSMNGFQLGNVYTALRAYISDFGLFGMILLVLLHAFIFIGLYRWISRRNFKFGKIDIPVLMYMYIVHAIYLFSIDDRFYMNICSVETIKIFIIFVVISAIVSVEFNGLKVRKRIKR